MQVLATVIVATALVVAVAFAAVSAFERSDRSAPLAAGLAMLPVAWCFYYIPARSAFPAVSPQLSEDRVLVPLGLVMTLAAVTWLLRQSGSRLVGVSAFMVRFGLLPVVMVSVRVAASHAREPQMATRSALVRELARPLRTIGAPPPGRNVPPRARVPGAAGHAEQLRTDLSVGRVAAECLPSDAALGGRRPHEHGPLITHVPREEHPRGTIPQGARLQVRALPVGVVGGHGEQPAG